MLPIHLKHIVTGWAGRLENAWLLIPNNSNILFTGTRRDGLFESTDKGDTWPHISSLMVPFDFEISDG
ncbi:MAG: hypothetical protein WD491_05780 [Balneolales bacterium]